MTARDRKAELSMGQLPGAPTSLGGDDHGPKAGCRAYECGIPADAHNCPFTRDKRLESARPAVRQVEPLTYDRHTGEPCKHEWRQVITQNPQLDLRFFCIHCLIIVDEQEKLLHHIS